MSPFPAADPLGKIDDVVMPSDNQSLACVAADCNAPCSKAVRIRHALDSSFRWRIIVRWHRGVLNAVASRLLNRDCP